MFKKIAVIGLGYIGLPTAAVLASRGLSVLGVDINPDTVNCINQGNVHIVEPDLDALVRVAVEDGFLTASTEITAADVFIIAVPTPLTGDHEPDVSYIEAATHTLAPVLKKGNLIVLESTSPIGTTEKIAAWLQAVRPDLHLPTSGGEMADIAIAHCPERVLPGKILQEIITNNRIIGGITGQCAEKAQALYQIFVQGECILTHAREAELAKLAENAFRDINIAYANELSMLCDRLEIDPWRVIELANHHPRVNILQPGPGVGGHCIAVDPWFIAHSAPELTPLIQTARQVNIQKTRFIVEKVLKLAKTVNNPVIACLGLSFKADIDDLRESPAVRIVNELAAENIATLQVVEPHINRLPDDLLHQANVNLVDLKSAVDAAHIVLLLVNHKVFTVLSTCNLSQKQVVDTRGILT